MGGAALRRQLQPLDRFSARTTGDDEQVGCRAVDEVHAERTHLEGREWSLAIDRAGKLRPDGGIERHQRRLACAEPCSGQLPQLGPNVGGMRRRANPHFAKAAALAHQDLPLVQLGIAEGTGELTDHLKAVALDRHEEEGRVGRRAAADESPTVRRRADLLQAGQLAESNRNRPFPLADQQVDPSGRAQCDPIANEMDRLPRTDGVEVRLPEHAARPSPRVELVHALLLVVGEEEGSVVGNVEPPSTVSCKATRRPRHGKDTITLDDQQATRSPPHLEHPHRRAEVRFGGANHPVRTFLHLVEPRDVLDERRDRLRRRRLPLGHVQ